jgi:hypothetical protein
MEKKLTAVEWLETKVNGMIENGGDADLLAVIEHIQQAKEMEKEQQGYSEEEAYSIWQAGQNYGVTSGSSITFEELTKLLRNKKR